MIRWSSFGSALQMLALCSITASAACSAGGDGGTETGSRNDPGNDSPDLGDPDNSDVELGVGSGGASGADPDSTPDPDCDPEVTGVVRDFKQSHPDMKVQVGHIKGEKGIVKSLLGSDHKPTFSGGDFMSVQGAESFSQWYNDTPDVNQAFRETLPLVNVGGNRFVFESNAFFPIDDTGFDERHTDGSGVEHNYLFTFELHMRFRYQGGETFEFYGDDDLFVFMNDVLVIDLGGIHTEQRGQVDLDARAAELGLQIGEEYPLDLFHAERAPVGSNFRLETNLAFTNCEPIIY